MARITIKESHLVSELVVLKSRLESEGIDCFLKNELTAQVISYIPAFLVELQVDELEVGRVQKIMSETGDSIIEGRKIFCPECGSEKLRIKLSFIERIKVLFVIFSAAIVMANIPTDKLFKQTKLRCKECGTDFLNA